MINISLNNNGSGGGAGGNSVSGNSNLSSGQMSSAVSSLSHSNVSNSNVGLGNNSSRIAGESNSAISSGSPFIYRPNRGHPNFNPTKPVVQITQRNVCFQFQF